MISYGDDSTQNFNYPMDPRSGPQVSGIKYKETGVVQYYNIAKFGNELNNLETLNYDNHTKRYVNITFQERHSDYGIQRGKSPHFKFNTA